MDCFFVVLKCRVCEIFRTFRFSRFLHVSFFKSSTFRFAGFTAAGYKLAPQLGQFFLCYRCICFTSGTHSFASPNGFHSIPTTTKKADAQDSPPCTSAFAYTHSMKLLLHSVYLIILLSSFYYRRILPVVVHIKPC